MVKTLFLGFALGLALAGQSNMLAQSSPPVPIVSFEATALRQSPYEMEACLDEGGARQQALYVGYSFLFSKLSYKESFAAGLNDFATGTLQLLPIENSFELTPRVWVGWRGLNGAGLRGSYWNYDPSPGGQTFVSNGIVVPSATSTSVIFPALIVAPLPGDQLSVMNSQQATTADVEGTLDVRIQRLELNFGGGLRYAHSDQRFAAAVTPGPVPGATGAALNWLREFEGFGPLFTARGKMPIGCRGLYGLGGVNVSFLFGEKTLQRTVINDATPLPNRGLPILVFDSDEITGVYGANLGLGWEGLTRFGRLAIEGTYEGQLWTDGGAPTITFAGFNGLGVSLQLAY